MADKGGGSSWYNCVGGGGGKPSGGKKMDGGPPREQPLLAQKLDMLSRGALDLGWMSAADGTEETVKKLIEFNLMIGSEEKLLAGEKRWTDLLLKVSTWMDKYLEKKKEPAKPPPPPKPEKEDGSGCEDENEDEWEEESEEDMPDVYEEPKQTLREFKIQVLNDQVWKELWGQTHDRKLLAHAIVYNLLQKTCYDDLTDLESAKMLYNAVVGANGWKKSFCADINIFEMTVIASISLVVWRVLDNVPPCPCCVSPTQGGKKGFASMWKHEATAYSNYVDLHFRLYSFGKDGRWVQTTLLKFLKEQDEEALTTLEKVKRVLSDNLKEEYRTYSKDGAKETKTLDRASPEERIASKAMLELMNKTYRKVFRHTERRYLRILDCLRFARWFLPDDLRKGSFARGHYDCGHSFSCEECDVVDLWNAEEIVGDQNSGDNGEGDLDMCPDKQRISLEELMMRDPEDIVVCPPPEYFKKLGSVAAAVGGFSSDESEYFTEGEFDDDESQVSGSGEGSGEEGTGDSGSSDGPPDEDDDETASIFSSDDDGKEDEIKEPKKPPPKKVAAKPAVKPAWQLASLAGQPGDCVVTTTLLGDVKKGVHSYAIKRYSEAAASFAQAADKLSSAGGSWQEGKLLYLACVCLCETRLPENVAKGHKMMVKMLEENSGRTENSRLVQLARTGLVYANFLKREYKACDKLLKEGVFEGERSGQSAEEEEEDEQEVSDLMADIVRPDSFLGPVRDFVTGCDVPKPDGVCRLEPECLSANLNYGLAAQPNIYYSVGYSDFNFKDIDFKGMHTLHCDQKCKIDFHTQCWKTYKETSQPAQGGGSSDRDFLASACPTPDCPGLVCGISVVRENGEELPTFKDDELIAKVKAAAKEAAAAKAAAEEAAAKEAEKAAAAKLKNKGAKKKTVTSYQHSSSSTPTPDPGTPQKTALKKTEEPPEEGFYPPGVPVRYYDAQKVEEMLRDKEGEVMGLFTYNRRLLNQQRLDVQKKLETSRAKTKKQTEEINRLKGLISAEKTRYEELMEQQANAKLDHERAVLEKHLTKRRISKETHTLMHDEVLQFHRLARMVMKRVMPRSTGLQQLTSEQEIIMKRIDESMAVNDTCEPTQLFKVQRPYEPSGLVAALERAIELRLQELRLPPEQQSRPRPFSRPPPPFGSNAPPSFPDGAAGGGPPPPFPQSASATAAAAQPPDPQQASHSNPTVLRFESIIGKVKEVFPEMTSEKVVEHLVRIKVESQNGEIAGYSVDQILGNIQDYQEESRNNAAKKDAPKRLPPSLVPRARLVSEEQDPNCSICLEILDPKGFEELRSLEGCGHLFHSDCIRMWFNNKRECPLCRLYQVPPEDFPSLGTGDRAAYRRNN